MTISTTKTWQFDLNGVASSDTTLSGTGAHFARRKMMLAIANSLKGFGTQPWTLVSNTNSVDAPSGVNQWVDEDDLVWRDDDTANAFSWMVIRQTGISTTFELLITLEENSVSNDGAEIGAWVAQDGFTGGSTTARPTATDEREILVSTGGYWGSGPVGSNNSYRWHVMQSTDGECTRVLIFIDEVNTGLWLFDKPKNPKTAWSDPYIAVMIGDNNTSTNQCSYPKFHDATNMKSRFDTSGVDTTMYLSGEGFGTNASGENLTVDNQLDGTFEAFQMGITSLTPSFVGRNGEVFDLWWGLTNAGTGRYYPDTGTKSYVQVHHMIFPWDGSSLLGTK
jgi:hypothetical protein